MFLNKFLSITFFIVLTLLFVFLVVFLSIDHPIKNIKDYEKCLERVQYKEQIKHFPKKIPLNMQKSRLYCSYGGYSGDDELVLLLMKTNSDYVKQEMKNHSFMNSDTLVGKLQQIYYMPSHLVKINPQDLTYYVLKNGSNYNENEKYFPYYDGIGVSKNMDYILYYHIYPQD